MAYIPRTALAPSDADFLVGTADADLSAEIAVGTSPGGELGGTWASPTVDTTHSGSAHHAESHSVASHSDTTATGAELEELTDGSETSLHSHAGGGGGMLKTASGGYFLIPAGPANGTSISSSSSANTYGSWTQMIASTSAALFIVGFTVEPITTSAGYSQIDIATGASASETSIGEWKISNRLPAANNVAGTTTVTFPFPIPVATATRIACRAADEEAAARTHNVSLICINQSDLVSI